MSQLKTFITAMPKIVNYIRSQLLHGRELHCSVEEFNSAYGDLLFCAEVTRLSKSQVLNLFSDCLPQMPFLSEKNSLS